MYIYLSYCNVSLYRISVFIYTISIERWSSMTCIHGRIHLLNIANTGVLYHIVITSLLLQNGELDGEPIFRRLEFTCGVCAIQPLFVELTRDHTTLAVW